MLSTKNNPFLNRNLSFNIKCDLEDKSTFQYYYIHTMSQSRIPSQMKEHIDKFMSERSKNTKRSVSLCEVVNKANIDTINEFELEDIDFFVEYFGCLFCKNSYFSFVGLFFHMLIAHQDWDFHYMKYLNASLKKNEMHVIANKNEEEEGNVDEDGVKSWSMIVNNERRKDYVVSKMKEKNISKILINLEKKSPVDDEMTNTSFSKRKGCNSESTYTANLNTDKSLKKNYKKYEDYEAKRVFFHSVTGGILHSDSEDSDYVLDEEDQQKFVNNSIDQFSDICDADKNFFKMWNEFVHNRKDKSKCFMKDILIDFIKSKGKEIICQQLNTNFMLHLINLHDHGSINAEVMREVVMSFSNLKDNADNFV